MSIAIDPRLSGPLRRFARRRRQLKLLRGASLCTLVAVAAFGLAAAGDYWWIYDARQRWIASLIAYLLVGVAALVTLLLPCLRPARFGEVAVQIEPLVPELKGHLLSAVELSPYAAEADGRDSLQFRGMLRDRVANVLEVVPVGDLLPWRLVRRPVLAAAAAAGLVLSALLLPGAPLGPLLGRVLFPTANIAPISGTRITLLEPPLETPWVAANEPIDVVASIRSDRPHGSAPRIEIERRGASRKTVPLATAPEASRFRWRGAFDAGSQPLRFRITAGDGATIWHRLVPQPRPVVDAFEFHVELPGYANEPPRRFRRPSGDLRVLSGSRAELRIELNQPEVLATLQTSASGVQGVERQPFLPPPPNAGRAESMPDRVQMTRLPVTQNGTYHIELQSSRTGLRNAFPPRYRIEVVEDRPARLSLQRLGSERRFCLPRELLQWRGTMVDELAIDVAELEVALNDGSFEPLSGAGQTAQPIVVAEGEASADTFRVTAHREWMVDAAELDLQTGDQLRLRMRAVDRRGASSYSEVRTLRVAEDAFAADRHVYLRGWLQMAALLRQWSGSPVRADSQPPISDSDELPDAIMRTAGWLVSHAPTPTDAEQTEWLWRAVHQQQLTRYSGDVGAADTTKDTQARQRLAEQANDFATAAAGRALLRDLLAVQRHIEDTLARVEDPDGAWERRQLELLAAYQRDVAEWLSECLTQLSGPAVDALRVRAERLRTLGDELEHNLQLPARRGRPLRLVENLRDSLENDLRNAVVHGEIPNRTARAFADLRRAVASGERLDAEVPRLADQAIAADDSGAAAALRAALRRWRLDQTGMLELHRQRDDFAPQRVEDLELALRAVAALEEMTAETLPPLSSEQNSAAEAASAATPETHWRQVSEATHTLQTAHNLLAIGNLWRPLLSDERWSTETLTRRWDNPRRWERITAMLEAGARECRAVPALRELREQWNQLRWQMPANRVGEVILRRRWDPALQSSAADDLAEVYEGYLSTVAELDRPMKAAREILRRYLAAPTPQSSPSSAQLASDTAAAEAEPRDAAAEREDAAERANAAGADEASSGQPDASAAESADSPLQALLAALERAANSPQQLIERLERRLAGDPPMQRTLDQLTKHLIDQAVAGLEQTERDQQSLRQLLEQQDAALAVEKGLLAETLKDLGEQAEGVAEALLERGRNAASRAATRQAADELDRAEERLRQAARTAAGSDARETAADLTRRATELAEALSRAAELAQSASRSAAAEKTTAIENDTGRRQRTRTQMQAQINRARRDEIRRAEQSARRWNQLARRWERETERTARENKAAQEALQKAKEQRDAAPDDTNRQRRYDDAAERAAQAERRARATAAKQAAAERNAAAAERATAARREARATQLSEENSAAEAAELLGRQAAEASAELSARAAAIAQSIPQQQAAPESLALDRGTARRAAAQLENAQREIAQVASSLQRAARHAGRLGEDPLDAALRETAADVGRLGREAAQRARQQAAEAAARESVADAEAALADGAPLARATASLQQQLRARIYQLQQLRGARPGATDTATTAGSDAGDPESPTAEGGAEEASQAGSENSAANRPAGGPAATSPAGRPRADTPRPAGTAPPATPASPLRSPQSAARLLDDLDRLLNADAADEGGAGAPGRRVPAGQASPLLAETAAQLRRQLARSEPASAASTTATEGAVPSTAENRAAAILPSGNADARARGAARLESPAGGGPLKRNRDWAKLRERRAEEVGQSQQSGLPLEYRAQIEAYFRVLAERSQ